jgi:hypothetical protein
MARNEGAQCGKLQIVFRACAANLDEAEPAIQVSLHIRKALP